MSTHLYPIGIYEKALPAEIDWLERLTVSKIAGYDFIEMSIDESDWRLERLLWNKDQIKTLNDSITRAGIGISSMCLSAHRRFPLGSDDPTIRQRSRDILQGAIDLGGQIGVNIILVPGYDVFYEQSTQATEERFLEGLFWATELASQAKITLALENTDKYVTSIQHAKKIVDQLDSSWFQVYGDIGNLAAMGYDIREELRIGADKLAGIHIKDAFPGITRGVPLGKGIVQFEEIFNLLREIHFNGSLMLELWNEDPEESVRRITQARQFIREKLESSRY